MFPAGAGYLDQTTIPLHGCAHGSQSARGIEFVLAVISRTAETLLELIQNRHSLRVEWYIVALILVEIGLTLFQTFR